MPSPLERAERLEAALRAEGCARVPRLYLKRDDLLSLALGGNKLRNLEFLLGDALAQGATDIVTAGRVQSNHCRLTAASCVRGGLGAHLIFTGERPAVATGNFLLDNLFGARTYFTGSDDGASRAALIDTVTREITDAGCRPYVIPVGGSDARGAVGHALAALELAQQFDVLSERLTRIVLATATGGTQAGMLAGLRRLGIDAGIYGVAVAKSSADLAPDILGIANEVTSVIGAGSISAAEVVVDDACLGAGYGIPSPAGQAAIELLARTEGVLADPVYTGKGLAGLLALVRDGAFSGDETVVFIHTGGAPAIFADLPPPL